MKIVSYFSKTIKNSVYEVLDKEIFKENYIVDLDLRSSGIVTGKKSFMNLEITFFTNQEFDFKDVILKESLRRVTRNIYIENFKKNKYFDFTISKKVKEA
jgi:hypothetical protein